MPEKKRFVQHKTCRLVLFIYYSFSHPVTRSSLSQDPLRGLDPQVGSQRFRLFMLFCGYIFSWHVVSGARTTSAKPHICFWLLFGVLAPKTSSRRALKCDLSSSVQHEYFGENHLLLLTDTQFVQPNIYEHFSNGDGEFVFPMRPFCKRKTFSQRCSDGSVVEAQILAPFSRNQVLLRKNVLAKQRNQILL